MADRKDFWFRQIVKQSQLDDAFNDLENADREIVKDLLGFGFLISGPNPATVVEDGPISGGVQVNPLLGFDQLGRRLEGDLAAFQGGVDLGILPQVVDLLVDENAVSTEVATPGNEKTLTIFVEFERNQSDPQTDGNAATVFFEQEESIKFNVVQSAEASIGNSVPTPARSDQLILADVVRLNAQTTFQNADIDQSRRQDFSFNLAHGSSHAEAGADPIPNATAVSGQGGLMSGVDKIKLDAVDFTDSGIAALFNNQAALVPRSNGVIPAANSLDVTALMAGKSAGGSAAVEGVVTQSGDPNNLVGIRNSDGDEFSDGEGNKVYGRITVDNEGTPTTWTLSFFTRKESGVGETAFDMTPFSGGGAEFEWWVTETFALNNLPTFQKFFLEPTDEVAGNTALPISALDDGGSPIGSGFDTIQEGAEVSFTDEGGGVLSIAGGAPVGSIIPWYRPNGATAIPANWARADGSTVADAASPFNGLAIPNMSDKFVRGYSGVLGSYVPPAGTGGANTHNHGGATASTSIGNTTGVGGGATLTLIIDPHVHSIGSSSNVPEYVSLLFIMRIK